MALRKDCVGGRLGENLPVRSACKMNAANKVKIEVSGWHYDSTEVVVVLCGHLTQE